MSGAFADSFGTGTDSPTRPPASTTHPFDDDDSYLGYDPRLPSQRFDAFSPDDDAEDSLLKDDAVPPIFAPPSPYADDGSFPPPSAIPETPSPPPIYAAADPQGFSPLSLEINGRAFGGAFSAPDGPILPPPAEMGPEEGSILREWRRQNALQIQEKERREKESVNQIREEAEDYKADFLRGRKLNCETNKANNREKEKLFVANQAKFHAEADKNYWKTIAELIPREVPALEKKKGKKEEKKPSVLVIQGPKPGKPTDLSRMRQILLKLKHSPPPHMKPVPAAAPTMPSNDAKTAVAPLATPKAAAVAAPIEAVAVA
ncbi:clathrin light chain 2 [Phoenix dactylifera]|uniref:Clathrin light chain n=1 Tax=Phoenix dactylifera TaxID=42345 RepID=A0A8B7BTY9_PHODC|nr:clathrin light chain 2 [Phoenix dactylifera]